MTRHLAILLGVLLAACDGGSSSPPPPPPPSPAPPTWTFQYSPGMSVPSPAGNGGFTFTFPGTDGVHYLVKGRSGAISTGLSINYRIDATGAPIFDYRTNPNNNCGPGYPGTVQLYFQRAGDNMSGVGPSEFMRWFASGYAMPLSPGAVTVNAPLEPAQWVSVYGKRGNDPAAAAGWQDAIGNVGTVGMVFGGGCFAGHGLFVTSGTATMTATSFEAR